MPKQLELAATRPSQEQINEGYKQARVQARVKAVELSLGVAHAELGVAASRPSTGRPEMSMDRVLLHAKQIEDYILNEIEPPKQSSIERATSFGH